MARSLPWEVLLDEHAQAVAAGDEARRRHVRILAAARPELLALMDVAEKFGRAQTPVRPHTAFREGLKRELMRAWHERQTRPAPAPAPVVQWARRYWWIWGALASVLSLAGGLSYYLFLRRSQAA